MRFAPLACALLAGAAIAHCASLTELVVVVDTDLAGGAEVDEIDVSVDDGAGFVVHRSARVDGSGSLPLTLGVNGGEDPNATLTVRAIARLRGADVASATLRTGLTEGESKLAHVSICRSCGTSCAARDIAASALPAWSGTAPARVDCEGSGVADGGTDAGTDASSGDAAKDVENDAGLRLLAYWDFEEASGVVAFDRSGNNRDVGFSGTGVKRGPGKFGSGLVFSRLDGGETGGLDCDSYASDAGLFPSSGTLSFWWFDVDDAPAGTLPSSVSVFSNQTSARDHFFVSRFRQDPVQTMTLGFQFKDLDATLDDDYANGADGTKFGVTRAVWTRIVVTWTADAGALQVGAGTAVMPVPFYRPWAPNQPNCIFGRHAHGSLDEVRFYGRVLSEAEIATIP